MGKRSIFECDLCKQECEESEVTRLGFTKPGKRNAQKFDVCAACSEKTMTQLVGESKLPEGWGFNSSVGRRATEDDTMPRRSRRQELQEAEPDYEDDDMFVAEKRRARQAPEIEPDVAGEELDIRVRGERVDDGGGVGGPDTVQMTTKGGDCMHANKGRARLGTIGGVKGFYHRCSDCNAVIPAKSTEDRVASTRATPAADMREGHNSTVRKKNQ